MDYLPFAPWVQVGVALAALQVATAVQAASLIDVPPYSNHDSPLVDPEQSPLADQGHIAQLIPDATLGAESSLVNVGDAGARIEGGAIRGGNLFHSFQDFNVPTGQQVYFVNPDTIDTILSRVTGGNVSNIDGLLGVDGAAHLFLLNPNGVVFGLNAQLDIRGALTTSTAGALEFSDGSTFSALNPQGASLLTMSVPLGVQFRHLPQGDITSTGSLETGQDLTLRGHQLYLEGQVIAGGNLTLQAQDTVTLRDTAAQAFIARSGDDLIIQGNQGIDILTLQHLEQTPFVSGRDLVLISDGEISGDAHFSSGNNVQLLTLAGTPANVLSYYDPIIVADGNVVFGDYRGAALKVEATGSIQTGEIRINGPDTTLVADGSGSDEDLLASSQALILRAGVESVSGPNVPQTAEGTSFTSAPIPDQQAGSIVVTGRVRTLNSNGEDAGPIILEATGDIILLDRLLAMGQSFATNPAGNGGDVVISSESGDIVINDRVNTFSLATLDDAGNGGDVSIVAKSGDIFINDNVTAFSLSEGGDAGVGGNITITAESGDIVIDAASVNAFAIADQGNAGNGGNISLSQGLATSPPPASSMPFQRRQIILAMVATFQFWLP